MDTAIKKANEVIVNVAQNKDMLRLYRLHEKALSDYANGMDNAASAHSQFKNQSPPRSIFETATSFLIKKH